MFRASKPMPQLQLKQLDEPEQSAHLSERDCHPSYSCIHCQTHQANQDELISKLFQGNQGRTHHLSSLQDDPFRPQAGPMTAQQQQQLPLQHHHDPQQQQQQRDKQQQQQHQQASFYHQHRPLMPQASMPSLQSRNYSAMRRPNHSPSPSPSPPPAPPPLVRHSTYSVTSETITDSPMQHMRRPNYTPTSTRQDATSHNTNHPPDSYSYNPDNETDLLIGASSNKAERANFRRSGTTREPDATRWRPVSEQQMHGYSGGSEQAQYHADHQQLDGSFPAGGGGGSLQRHTATGRRSASNMSAGHASTKNPQHQSRMSLGRRQNIQTNSNSGKTSSARQAPGNDNTQHNSATTAFQYLNDAQQQQQQQQRQQHQQQQQQQEQEQQQQTSASNNQNSRQNSNFHSQAGPGGANVSNALPGGVVGAVNPFEAAATFCPPVLTIPPPPLPIGPMAIRSHRTNSPWMRLSSIILTPVGIVIAFFIVISPLLHYLM